MKNKLTLPPREMTLLVVIGLLSIGSFIQCVSHKRHEPETEIRAFGTNGSPDVLIGAYVGLDGLAVDGWGNHRLSFSTEGGMSTLIWKHTNKLQVTIQWDGHNDPILSKNWFDNGHMRIRSGRGL